MSGSPQNAASLRTKGNDMAGPAKVSRLRTAVHENLDSLCPVIGADTGRGAVKGVDGFPHGSPQPGGIVLRHHGNLELRQPFGGGGDEGHSAAELNHKVHG